MIVCSLGEQFHRAEAIGLHPAEQGPASAALCFVREDTMPKGPFSQSEFVPTEWSTATDKANFGNTLLRFLDADCSRELFTKKLYTRLSMTFGNIAHCNLEGFYDTWFTRDRHRLAFVQKILRWPCHGDPTFTFSDAERAVQRVVAQRNYLAAFDLRASEQLRATEMRELQRLEAKYRIPEPVAGEALSATAEHPTIQDAAVSQPENPVQISLF